MQWQLIQTLRQQRYDMVLNLADQWPSAVISKLTGAATRIGFDFPKRRHPVWRYCHTALAEGYAVVLTSGPDAREKKMVDTIIAGCPQARLHSLAGQLTLRQLAAVIDHARLFIGVDSVPMHMAAALGTPLVALFGPSKLTFWRPWQAKGEVIWAGDFGPLPDPDAINTNTDERYLDLIPTDAVIAAAKKVLA